MTTAEMLFGSGDLAPSNAAWGRVLGIARQTVGEKIRNPSLRRKRHMRKVRAYGRKTMKPDEAIELLKNMKWSITTKFNAVNNSTKALDMAITALEKQEADRWIPVTERLPEKEGCYLVAIKNDYNRIYSKTAWVGKDVWFKRQDILAWRPLPDPYEAEEES